jgi:hypothetical protein
MKKLIGFDYLRDHCCKITSINIANYSKFLGKRSSKEFLGRRISENLSSYLRIKSIATLKLKSLKWK